MDLTEGLEVRVAEGFIGDVDVENDLQTPALVARPPLMDGEGSGRVGDGAAQSRGDIDRLAGDERGSWLGRLGCGVGGEIPTLRSERQDGLGLERRGP